MVCYRYSFTLLLNVACNMVSTLFMFWLLLYDIRTLFAVGNCPNLYLKRQHTHVCIVVKKILLLMFLFLSM
jgi:hypothetical protein